MERHHLLFNRFAWSANEELSALRSNKQLIVPVETEVHRELHDSVSHVPPLSYHMARHTLKHFMSDDYTSNPIHAIDNLQRSIDRAGRHPRADRIEREVGELAIEALQLQKPFVDSDPWNTYYVNFRRAHA